MDPLTSSSPGFFLMMATSNEAGWITNGSLFLITNSSQTFDRLSHYKIKIKKYTNNERFVFTHVF